MLTFGNTPVPHTVSWSGEEAFFTAPCPDSEGRMAICQTVNPGVGKPLFGKPHSQRQRAAVVRGLCDLCGKPLQNHTKVSLSHAQVRTNGAEGPAVMQVEPMLHRECAAISMKHCPSLRRDIQNDTLYIRQVLRWRVQLAIMAPEFVHHYVPDYKINMADRFVGAAKVELLKWNDRDEAWLTR